MRIVRWIAAALAAAGLVAALLIAMPYIQRYAGGDGPLATRLLLSGLDTAISQQQIVETSIDVEVSPEQHQLRGHAELRVKAGPGVDSICLLLNPGLRITQATMCGEPVRYEQSQFVLRVFLSRACATPQDALVEIVYEGGLEDTILCKPHFEADEVILPPLALWYPLDLHSFSRHQMTVNVPNGVVVAGATLQPVEDGPADRQDFRWSADRPVMGAALVAGKYQSANRLYAGTDIRLYWPEERGLDTDALLQTLANVYNFQATAYGESGFSSVNLVLSDAEMTTVYGGNAVAMMSFSEASGSREERLLNMAELTAKIWWGGTVGVRWFSERPEAARWISESLPIFSSWQALEHFEGRRAFLRMVENLRAPNTVHTPMNAWPIADALNEDPLATQHLRVRGPLIAQMIAEVTGKDLFNTGCRNFFAVHAHSTASYAALRHELELAAEQDLEELFRVWLERGGTFDYAVQDVEAVGDQVTVTVSNKGDIPALHPLEIALITEQAAHIREVRSGAYTNTFTFSVGSPVKRVVLDPYFATADMARADNVWPRGVWPKDVAASSKGSFVVTFRRDWHDAPAEAAVWTGPDTARIELVLPGPMLMAPIWSPGGSALAIPAAVPAIWTQGEGMQLCREGGSVFGWREDELWLYQDRAALAALGAQVPLKIAPPPRMNSLRQSPVDGRLAWISEEAGQLHVMRADGDETIDSETEWQSVCDLTWVGDTGKLLLMTRAGELLRGDPLGEEMRSLLKLDYPVEVAALSRQGRFAAWLDEAGSLRVVQEDRMFPRLVPVPGEIHSLSWEGDAALLCLVAESSRLLPMRFHSEWSIYRIPATTWEAQLVDVDLTPPEGAPNSTPP